MVHQFRFDRVLTVREREKKEAEDRYRESVESFEGVAQQLYLLLKKKERMIEDQTSKIQNGIAVQSLRHGQQFLTNIEKSIRYQQKLVVEARSTMQWHEQRVADRNIEVRKYEKIKDKDRQLFMAKQSELDNQLMNELSMIQFMKQRSR
ncbi:flagellar export protein FliJ [Jeotgalibacillus sp. ET6]|uniref:flagellar export protein FliJ n=1 Tax=Jeotgalibacillus sp. ET6 TaxID=3037260 RepID=UPI00241880E2|nr:flagellar export protein FliJ [Jeotgalibacillus sp. ET6]MDG5470290.1 flagellar export protein FliJ [Jeotgalibacillus sp. ET6]